MPSWIAKAALQKAIALLPGRNDINYVFQKYVTKLELDDAVMEQALVHCADHVRHFKERRPAQPLASTLELGTGRFAVVPFGLYLCGAGDIVTVDVAPLLRADNLAKTIRKFGELHERGRLRTLLPSMDDRRAERLQALAHRNGTLDSEALLSAAGIRYLVADARRSSVSGGSIDLIHSNDVFEHIDPRVLGAILVEFRRVAKRGAVMSHFIDMTDHFSHFDRSIDAYHYLRYTDAQWRWIDNAVAPQNRMRLPEYRALYERCDIPIHAEKRWPGRQDALNAIRLAPRFQAMSPSDVAVTHAYLISLLE